jgi:RNA polymerase sigma-70 factor (ECF subfamily)
MTTAEALRPYSIAPLERAAGEAMTDDEVVERVLGGEAGLFEILMRRYNQRLFRVARAILRSGDEAEDVMQEAYVRAYTHLGQFAHRAQFSTWLTKIALHEAYARARRSSRLDEMDAHADEVAMLRSTDPDPERQLFDRELRAALEKAVDALPEHYRSVFVLREVEGLSTAETGECLGVGEEAIKTRLHRARGLLRRELYAALGAAATQAFPFHHPRCDRVVAAVFRRIMPRQP